MLDSGVSEHSIKGPVSFHFTAPVAIPQLCRFSTKAVVNSGNE